MGRAWFRAKRYGWGASMPITWQGWLTLAVSGVAVFVAIVWTRDTVLRVAGLTLVAVALSLVVARKTEGGVRWRWGEQPLTTRSRHQPVVPSQPPSPLMSSAWPIAVLTLTVQAEKASHQKR